MTNISERTLASIVSEKYQTVPVLEKYNLDFCCKGKRTLSEACIEKGLPTDAISKELEAISDIEYKPHMPFIEMDAEQLINHILTHHHFNIKQSMPSIMSHLEKVATKHGNSHFYMLKVRLLFSEIKEEMTMHMQKEEQLLFPRIKEIEAMFTQNKKVTLTDGFIRLPVNMMETEHDHAGAIMNNIRQLTNNYSAPVDACTTFKLSLAELKEFEEDLHRHVHLENNLLFPLAKKNVSTNYITITSLIKKRSKNLILLLYTNSCNSCFIPLHQNSLPLLLSSAIRILLYYLRSYFQIHANLYLQGYDDR